MQTEETAKNEEELEEEEGCVNEIVEETEEMNGQMMKMTETVAVHRAVVKT